MTEDDGLLFEPARDVADDWDGPGTAPSSEAALYLELDGWEGPLDLLLDLARRQKVDLKQISILALVDQYIAYIERAEALRLEIAADYLVMAAWLAYLKSAMLLPKDEQEDPSPEELALRLQLRLQRLGAHRLLVGEQGCLDRAGQLVGVLAHAGTRRRCIGPNTSSWRISALPSRASSSAATKLEASAERVSRGSAPTGKKSRSSIHTSLTPSIAETRSIAESSVMTMRSRTMCTTGSLRALTTA